MNARFVVLLVCTIVLASCAGSMSRMRGADSSSKYIDYAGEPVNYATAFRIDGWTPVSRNQLVLWTGIHDAYLLKVWDTCPDLQFATRIAISSPTQSIGKFDKVRVGRDQCPIVEIRPIDIKLMKAAEANARSLSRQAKPK